MTINCKICGNVIELPVELEEGQHVICPYCGKKFSYSRSSQEFIKQRFARVGNAVKGTIPKRLFSGRSMMIGGSVLFVVVLICIAGFSIFRSNAIDGFELDRQRVNAETCAIGESTIEGALTSGEVGKAYFYAQGNLVVQQVIPKCGILVGSHALHSPAALILTERNYIDGVELRPGLYACIGTARYPNKDGFIRTVLAFEEAEPKVSQQRLADLAKQKAEEELKRQKLAEEARIEREKAARAAREAAAEAEIAAAKLKAETDAKLAKMRQEEEVAKEQRRAESEKEALEAKAKADAEAAEEARKRYPAEQKMRTEYAANKISALKFDLQEYFIIEKALLSSLESASVTEDAWKQMKKAAREKDWLGVLSVAAGEQLKDYPNTQEIDRLVASIVEREFHAEFVWKKKSSLLLLKGWFSEKSGLATKMIFSDPIIGFSMKNIMACSVTDFSRQDAGLARRHRSATSQAELALIGKILVFRHENSEIGTRREKYSGLCHAYEEAVRLGKISEDTANQKKQEAFEKFKKEVLSIMSRSGFKASDSTSLSASDEFGAGSEIHAQPKSSKGSWSKIPTKKKREIDPSMKTLRGPTKVW